MGNIPIVTNSALYVAPGRAFLSCLKNRISYTIKLLPVEIGVRRYSMRIGFNGDPLVIGQGIDGLEQKPKDPGCDEQMG